MPGFNKGTYNAPELPEFDPESIRPEQYSIINAPRDSGKSTMLFHWMTYLTPKIVVPIVISHSEIVNSFFETKCKIPKQFIHYKFDEQIISNALRRAEELKTNPPPGYCYDLHSMTTVFLDDVQNNTSIFANEPMRELSRMGRQKNVGMLMCSQYMPSINKGERGQLDRVALLYDKDGSNREFAYNAAFSSLSWELFNWYYEKYTENYGSLIYSKGRGKVEYTHFRADMSLLDNYEDINLKWNEHSTINYFASHCPIQHFDSHKLDWSQSKYGLSSFVPVSIPSRKGRKSR